MHSWSWPPGFVIAPVIRGSMALLSRVQARSSHLLLMSCSMVRVSAERERPGQPHGVQLALQLAVQLAAQLAP